ncbi:MAG: hypothetical protein ABII22_03065 [Candidatus Micrarchaeota archaeon]
MGIYTTDNGKNRARGMRIIEDRFQRAYNYILSHYSDGAVATFAKGHLQYCRDCLEEGIRSNLITPEAIIEEANRKGDRGNLLLLDILSWSMCKEPGLVPWTLLGNPLNDGNGYDPEYLSSFARELGAYDTLRTLDCQEGYDAESYAQVLTPQNGDRPPVALLARLAFVSRLWEHNLPASVTTSESSEIQVPEIIEWINMERNTAESVMGLYANLGDLLGFPSLVKGMKNFAMLHCFPDIWNYVEGEMGRISREVEASNAIIREMSAELKLELRKHGIAAEVEPREEGKGFGSLGVKIKKRYEERCLKMLELAGIPKEMISLNVKNPFIRDVKENACEGIEFSVDGHTTSIKVEGTILVLSVIDQQGKTTSVMIDNKHCRYLFGNIDEYNKDQQNGSDFAAGRIIIDSFNGSTTKESLVRAANKINNQILPKCIERALAKRGIHRREYRTEVTDYINPPIENSKKAGKKSLHDVVRRKGPKANEYRSLHIDTRAYDPTLFAPFEWIIRSRPMHEFSERGGAAHAIYKGAGELTRRFAETYRSLVSMMTKTRPGKVTVRELAQLKIRIRIGEQQKTALHTVPQNRLLVDALVDMGIELNMVEKVKDVRDVKNEVDLGALAVLEKDMELQVIVSENGGFIPTSLIKMLIPKVGGLTAKQLRDIQKQE